MSTEPASPPRPPPRIPDGQPNPHHAAHRAHLAQLREEFVLAAHGPRAKLKEEAEWNELPGLLRFFVLTHCGHDDPDAGLQRRWREFTPSEQQALRTTLREWRRMLQALRLLIL